MAKQVEDLVKMFGEVAASLSPECVRHWLENREKFQKFLVGDPMLEFVTEVKIPATTTQFIAKKKFVVDMSPGAKVKISCLWGDFKAWFWGKTEEPMPETVLRAYKLRTNSPDAPIIAELGGQKKAEITLQEIFSLMEKQGHGEAGTLLTNGCANIFYVRDKDGVLRAVYVIWLGVGWGVYANSVRLPGAWRDGDQVFSRNS